MASQDNVFEKVDDSKLSELTIYPEAEESTDGGEIQKGYIYVIAEQSQGSINTGMYKVGKTGNLEERIRNLQTGNERHLCYWYWWKVNDMTAAEEVAHTAVTQYRATGGGGREWFYVPQANLEDFLSCIQQAITQYIVY